MLRWPCAVFNTAAAAERGRFAHDQPEARSPAKIVSRPAVGVLGRPSTRRRLDRYEKIVRAGMPRHAQRDPCTGKVPAVPFCGTKNKLLTRQIIACAGHLILFELTLFPPG